MISVAVTETSQIAAARRRAAEIAEKAGFNVVETGRVAIVSTELATNILKHGGGGEILIGTHDDAGASGVELIALDRGPGMANPQACLADGFSNVGSAGNGLGAVIRQSHVAEIVSWPNMGCAIRAALAPGQPPKNKDPSLASLGAISIAKPGEDVCGDAWSVDRTNECLSILVADGLGHGPEAAKAAVEAVRVFQQHKNHQVTTLIEYIHAGLRSTRGAAIAVARVDAQKQKVEYAGIGNVAGLVVSGNDTKHMVSLPGTAGHNARKIQAFDYPLMRGLVIVHSDGLGTSWKLDRYPGLHHAHPTLIAAVLYRDFWRRRDDVTVIVAKGVAVQ